MIKRTLALISAAAVIASALTAVPVYAKQTSASTAAAAVSSGKNSSDKDMEAALKTVKSRITIPKEYSEFDCDINEYRGETSYRFRWRRPDGDSYSVTFCGNMITSYHSPFEYDYTPEFTEIESRKFVQNAKDFILKTNPQINSVYGEELKQEGETIIALKGNSVDIRFSRVCKDVNVTKNYIHVTLDKLTGKVISMNADWWQDAEFDDSGEAVSAEKIISTYSSEVKLKPWYRIQYDPQTDKKTASVVYEPLNSFVYDALSGKHSTMDKDYAKLMNTDLVTDITEENGAMNEEAAVEEDCDDIEEAEEIKLTSEEKAALENLKKKMTSEQFRKKLLDDKYLNITSKYIVNSFEIVKSDSAPCGYIINCTMHINNDKLYRNVYITADAESGKIISFSKSGSTDSEKPLDAKAASALAKEAAEYYYGDIFGEYVADPDNTKAPVNTKEYTVTSRSMKYYRYVNNIQVTGNNITVSVNSDGEVKSINVNHTEDVDFGNGKIISAESALKQLFKQTKPELYYDGFKDLESQPHTYLCYKINSWSLNAVSGKLCDYYGNTLAKPVSSTSDGFYTDVSKSPYKDEIRTLFNHGVRISENRLLEPDKKITAEELDMLLDAVNRDYPVFANDRFYYSPDTKKTDGFVTRAGLAAEFTNRAGIDNCADFADIFRSPFKDVKDNDKNIGYICLAYGLGAVTADSDGNFRPDEYVTREYALHCIYNYIISMNAE